MEIGRGEPKVSARYLMAVLKRFGYQKTRQTGSHLRLTTSENGEHHITIPQHDALQIIAFFVWVRYKKGQPFSLAPAKDVLHSKGKCYKSNAQFFLVAPFF